MTYKIQIHDRQYSSWDIYNSTTLEKVDIDVNPMTEKLMNNDIFTFDSSKVEITHSILQNTERIQGVLVLVGKMYGKISKDKYLFRCIPDDKRLPEFLIPYKIKIHFKKKKCNKYILFKFLHWKEKHPRGTIIQILGDVTNLNSFYEYQLYCKSLYASIQEFTKKTMNVLRLKSSDYYIQTILKKYKLENRQDWNIYSIDPNGSRDFDDAFSIYERGENILLSIYISNVTIWLDTLNLWDSFSERIATIYLPDRKRPMLPTILSDALCSLQEKNIRFAFTLDLWIDMSGKIIKTNFLNTSINLKKNYIYHEMDEKQEYKLLFETVAKMNTIEGQEYMVSLKDSHDIIAYLMIMMNFFSGKELTKHKSGIFRSIKIGDVPKTPSHLPKTVQKFLKGWNSSGGKYVPYGGYCVHDLLKLDAYIHITSPIRRLIDLLNITNLQSKLGLFKHNHKSEQFMTKWNNRLDYINKTMRSIRKVQNDCSLLDKCIYIKNPIFSGYLFDKIMRSDGLFQYMVYLPDINMINRFVTNIEYICYKKYNFKIYIFMDEIRLKQKLRVDIIFDNSI